MANTCAATCTTNSVEGYFSIFKRGMKGTYQHCKEKHLHRYLAEFDFRYMHCNSTRRPISMAFHGPIDPPCQIAGIEKNPLRRDIGIGNKGYSARLDHLGRDFDFSRIYIRFQSISHNPSKLPIK